MEQTRIMGHQISLIVSLSFSDSADEDLHPVYGSWAVFKQVRSLALACLLY